uniref:DNA-binding transcriptional regulator NtrC n=1 Tax=Desulfacinum infernum TaxID=35837 RepID=A0A831ZY08_9BACT
MAMVLVVDDEKTIRFAFETFLRDEGHTALLAGDVASARRILETARPDIVFLDYRLPDEDGLSLLAQLRAERPDIAVIFMTAFGAMDVAIRAMQLGAYEYLTKPLDLSRIRELIGHILDGRAALHEEASKPKDVGPRPEPIVGRSAAMQTVFKMIGLLTTQDVTVLITGESGVGKELVARAIHEHSDRRSAPFVAVNCGAMPETLLEAEMFGYEKGAFTGAERQKPGKFEIAGHGTIFLDEIGELHPGLQVKLLRVLQERTFERVGGTVSLPMHARILAATNKNLYEEMLQGRFRRDLYYRLHLIHIHLPPLRERMDDVPLLVEHFVEKCNRELGRRVRGLSPGAMERFLNYSWPGNVRELENEIKRAMVLSRDEVLNERLFELGGQVSGGNLGEDSEEVLRRAACRLMDEKLRAQKVVGSILDEVVSVVEAALLREALHKCQGNQLQASELLGIHRATLRKKKKDYGL